MTEVLHMYELNGEKMPSQDREHVAFLLALLSVQEFTRVSKSMFKRFDWANELVDQLYFFTPVFQADRPWGIRVPFDFVGGIMSFRQKTQGGRHKVTRSRQGSDWDQNNLLPHPTFFDEY